MSRPKYKELHRRAISTLDYAKLQLKVYEHHFGKLTEKHFRDYQIHRLEEDVKAPNPVYKALVKNKQIKQ